MKIEYRVEWNHLVVDLLDINPDFFGKKAYAHFSLEVKVQDSSPIHSSRKLWKHEFVIEESQHTFRFENNSEFYHYTWEMIHMYPQIHVRIDDSIFFDTKISKKITKELSRPPKVRNNPKKVLNPKDTFNLLYNLKSISHADKVVVLSLFVVWAIVIAANMLLGIHDQMSPESMTYFYSHYDSDGDSSSPFLNALGINGWIGFTIWLMIKKFLRKYMRFSFKKISWKKRVRDHSYRISHLLKWKSRVDLKNVTLKIVAGNIEKGKYTRGSGTNKRTVSFSNPVRAVQLFSKKYNHIPKETEISDYLKGEVSFLKMYTNLYPELKSTNKHGLFVHWEVQLIHDKLIDQELIGTQDICDYINFLDAK